MYMKIYRKGIYHWCISIGAQGAPFNIFSRHLFVTYLLKEFSLLIICIYHSLFAISHLQIRNAPGLTLGVEWKCTLINERSTEWPSSTLWRIFNKGNFLLRVVSLIFTYYKSQTPLVSCVNWSYISTWGLWTFKEFLKLKIAAHSFY